MRPLSLVRCLALLLAALLVTARPGAAQSLPEPLRAALRSDNPVVAVVNGAEIRWNDVVLSALALPAEYQSQVPALFPVLLGRLIDMQLIADKARAEGVGRRADFQARLRQMENELLREYYLTDLLTQKVTAAEIEQRVAVLTAGSRGEELRLSIIVTASEEESRAVLRRLEAGEDFAVVARERSLDGSAPHGGDLGYFAEGELQPPALAEQAFGLRIGQHAQAPLQGTGGWTLIKVTDRRKAEPLPRSELAERIRRELTRLALDALLAELRAAASIDLFPK